MKFDLMVYGRGVERLEGYQTFAQPSYWTEKMLLFLSEFNELSSASSRKEADPAAFEADDNPWADTYLFVCMPPPYCCALLRCTRVEGDTPGTWLKEVRNQDIWSTEGWCCPFEQRDQFFALLPSLLIWMKKDRTALYGRLRRGQLQKSIELPETVVFNPYMETDPPEDLYAMMGSDSSQEAWLALYQKIYLSSQPFAFIFGPLANYYAKKIGKKYQVQSVFSTIADQQEEQNALADPFRHLKYLSMRKPVSETHDYYLRYCHEEEARKELRRWCIYEKKKNGEQKETLISTWKPIPEEKPLRMIDLISEADVIREFVEKMQWSVASSFSDVKERYHFRKED